MNTISKIVTVVLLLGSIALFAYLFGSVQSVIDEREAVASKEQAVIERLKLIREAQLVYQEVKGNYTANWDSLINFIQNGQVPILERSEEIIQKPYGGEEVILHIDTLGYIPARERIFKKTYSVNASDNGTFAGFRVKVGDEVIKNQKAYAIRVGSTVKEAPFAENGTITNLAEVSVGDAVTKGQPLITMFDYQFNPNVDVSRLAYKPGTDEKFDIYVGSVDKAGIKIQVIEVTDPKPDNPARRASNEQRTRKPLHFGSRSDVTTSGNWE